MSKNQEDDRRTSVRLASHVKLDAAVVDRYEQPIRVLRDAEVLNVSAGGLMLSSDTPAGVGEQLLIKLAPTEGFNRAAERLELETLECLPAGTHKHQIRCKLVTGRMPARMIYGW